MNTGLLRACLVRPDWLADLWRRLEWSEWRDSNPRPSGPKPDALPGCATLRRARSIACDVI